MGQKKIGHKSPLSTGHLLDQFGFMGERWKIDAILTVKITFSQDFLDNARQLCLKAGKL